MDLFRAKNKEEQIRLGKGGLVRYTVAKKVKHENTEATHLKEGERRQGYYNTNVLISPREIRKFKVMRRLKQRRDKRRFAQYGGSAGPS